MFNVNDLTNVVKRMISQRKSPVKRFFTFIVKFLMLEAVRKAAFRDFRRDQYTYCRVFAAFLQAPEQAVHGVGQKKFRKILVIPLICGPTACKITVKDLRL